MQTQTQFTQVYHSCSLLVSEVWKTKKTT